MCDTPVFTTSRFGKPVLYLGRYRYNMNTYCKGDKARWVCTKVSLGCRATVTTFCGQVINVKNCPFSRSVGSASLLYCTMDIGLTNTAPVKGREDFTCAISGPWDAGPVLIYGGYRYNQHSSSSGARGVYVCTKRNQKCRASIRTIDKIRQCSQHRVSESLCYISGDTGIT
ncbi:Uncharacterized protein OBRU01_19366 [Operophtera brumata]|uniref:FLYWCH-type domain-containing protein n=1 Tax=Operophtera brumata TaxID=104452 RepID=A0A0L7KS70_OPEBR|nr:Uncharacterized protein OBRU01_19366 [Operophtera brumata]